MNCFKKLLCGSEAPACSKQSASTCSHLTWLQLTREEWSPQNCLSFRTAINWLVLCLQNQEPAGLAPTKLLQGGRRNYIRKYHIGRGAKVKLSELTSAGQASPANKEWTDACISTSPFNRGLLNPWRPFNKHPKEDIFLITKEFFTVLTYHAEHGNQL